MQIKILPGRKFSVFSVFLPLISDPDFRPALLTSRLITDHY